ncbi:hypothetical protein SEPCBS57363_003217 [Sporothrix epigloea]|uniref:WW domain-containing protein n=1 Tax=Sporothrix epigloea TaxID=1892477 RepID=A0ABP0DM00_9PEZI
MASSAEEHSDGVDAAASPELDDEASKLACDKVTSAKPDMRSASQADEAGSTTNTKHSSAESHIAQDVANSSNSSSRPTSIKESGPLGNDNASTAAAPSSPPPLPDEPLPDESTIEDDGWDPVWSEEHQAWYFVNRFTQQTQWENPRLPTAATNTSAGSNIGGYNPAIHGDYDPAAWYATGGTPADDDSNTSPDENSTEADPIAAAAVAAAAIIQGDSRHRDGASHNAKAARQLNAYFDVAAAGSSHDGRSLKAERSGIKPSKSELKAFKEKRRARKEEKRRAWLRD